MFAAKLGISGFNLSPEPFKLQTPFFYHWNPHGPNIGGRHHANTPKLIFCGSDGICKSFKKYQKHKSSKFGKLVVYDFLPKPERLYG